jgi:ATP-dependent Clp protease ATP-binding subunit ClpC
MHQIPLENKFWLFLGIFERHRMPHLHLNIPVLIQQSGSTFTARPLFLPFPAVQHDKFEKAIALFKSRISEQFKGFRLHRGNIEIVFWYQFAPLYELRHFSFKFQIKQTTVNGSFSVVHFDMAGKTFLSFPGFENYMAMAGEDKAGIMEEAERIIHKLLLREYQKNPEQFDPSQFLAPKREFVTDISQEVYIAEGPFKFRQPKPGFSFQFFRQGYSFIGEVELNKVGYSLNNLYPNDLRRAWFREELVEEISRAVFQGANTPIAIVGQEGAGRHSILEEALFRYVRDEAGNPNAARQKIWYMDPTRVISGMSIVGMWEKRLESMLQFIIGSGPKYRNDKILINNPVALTRIGRSASNDMGMSQVLKPYLEKRSFQLLLVASPQEWKLLQEKDRAFTDLFQVIRVNQPDLELAFKMVMERRRVLEAAYECQFTIQAIQGLFSTYRNFFRSKALPGVIVKWMQQFAVKYQGRLIDYHPEVLAEFKGISGFEELLLDSNLTFQENEVESALSRALVGQEEAVKALSHTIHLIKARLATPGKPLASYLFIGPTGVGKTQGAKALAEFLMGDARQIIRFDMNEYIDGGAAERLVGNYYQPEGQLISKVRYQPFGILLLDEIEKAHPGVHDLLLQVLDDGRLTDGRGRTVDFSNNIIIMTSNLGAREVSSRLGYRKDNKDDAAIYQKEVKKFFRPEFINRIDRIVVFNPLQMDHILEIARLQIQELLQREGFLRRTTMVNIDPKALEWVAKRGFDSQMGGRALKRQIEKDLTSLTAEQLISSKADQPVFFDIFLEDGKLTPRITPLHFAENLPEGWIPALPAAAQVIRFYQKLLQIVEKLNFSIQELAVGSGSEEGSPVFSSGKDKGEINLSLFQAKDQARELKERIKMTLMNQEDHSTQQPPVLPFRLKKSSGPFRWNENINKQQIQDLLFQRQALHEIYTRYQHGMSSFDSSATEFLQDYLDIAFLSLTRLALQKKRLDKGFFLIRSYLNGKGGEQTGLMLRWYEKLLESMQVPFRTDWRKNQIEAEGYGIAELFKAEEGIHLFFSGQEAPLPLLTYWLPDRGKAKPMGLHRQIIRLYDENRTITDLRTGLTNTFQITPAEMKVFLFAGLPEKLRQNLISK